MDCPSPSPLSPKLISLGEILQALSEDEWTFAIQLFDRSRRELDEQRANMEPEAT
jgi:hypothetical protein